MKLLSYKKTVLFSAACLTASFVLLLLARYADGFAQWYGVNIYPAISQLNGRFFSLWNHSFFEFGFLLILIIFAFAALFGISALVLRRLSGRKLFLKSLRILACAVSGLIFVFTSSGAVNYHRDSIGTVLNLPVQESTRESLIQLSLILAEDLTALTKDPAWDYSLLTANDFSYIETQAVHAMKLLGKQEPSLSGYYVKPKSIFFSGVLSGLGIEGIFSPFTMEANYNQAMTPFLIPYTICHELAHYKGYMKEDDAGFIAYKACRESPSMVFQYSGMFHAMVFTLNALKAETTPEGFNAVYQRLPEPIRIQLGYMKAQRQQQTTSFTSITKSANDIYLKANAQPGMKSYGRMVDLLIADYAGRINQRELL